MVTVKDLKEYLKSHNVKDDTPLYRATVVGTTKTKLETSGFTGIGVHDGNIVLWTNGNCCAAQEIWKKKYPFKDYIG